MQEVLEQVLSYLRGTWRYRWYAMVLTVVVCLIGWVYVLKLPDEFQASARVHVDTQSILRPLLRGLAVDTNPDAQLQLMTRTLLSRANLEKVARMTDLDLQVKDAADMDELIEELREQISLQSDGRQNLYRIAVDDKNPQLAKKIVQAVQTIFVETTLGETRQDSDTAQRFLDRQISEYEARLIAAENRVKEFKRENLGMMPTQGGDYYARLQAIQSQLAGAKLELRQAENRRDAISRQIQGEEPTFGLMEQQVPEISRFDAPSMAIDGRIQQMEAQLDQLLLQYTEKHPDIIALRESLGQLRRQRDGELAEWRAAVERSRQAAASSDGIGIAGGGLNTNPVFQQLKISLGSEEANIASLQVQVGEYEKRLQELQEAVHTIPEIEAKLASLNRDYDVTRENYETLLARRESARISQQAEQTTDDIRFRVIDPPEVPREPSGPNRPLLTSMVLGAGLAGGLGLAFVLFQINPTFDNRRMLMQATNIPVFGSVSAVLPPAALRRQRLGVLAFLGVGFCLLLVFAGLLVMETIGMRIF